MNIPQSHIKILFLAAILAFSVTSHINAGVPLEGQIIVDPENPRWLKYQSGGPFFLAGPGDPEGFLYRGSRNADGTRDGDQFELINKLKGTGANSIYLMAVRSHGGDGDATQNPFIDNDDTQALNQAVLDQWEAWFTEMDNNGIVIYFFFYDDDSKIWSGDTVDNLERNFLETLVNRFEHHKNLIWVIAEEYAEEYTPARISNIAEVIRNADDHDHVIAVHKNSGLNFDEFADDPNIDQFAIQYNKSDADVLHEGMKTAWQNAEGKYNLNMSEAGNYGSGKTARLKNWAIAMGGAYVMILFMDIESTATSDLVDLGRLSEFMESTNFNDMAPHDELALSDTQYVLASPGDSYIAYTSDYSSGMGLIGMEAGEYTFKWFDPQSGNAMLVENVVVEAGDRTWARPAEITGNEVAVYLIRSSSIDLEPPFPPTGLRIESSVFS